MNQRTMTSNPAPGTPLLPALPELDPLAPLKDPFRIPEKVPAGPAPTTPDPQTEE